MKAPNYNSRNRLFVQGNLKQIKYDVKGNKIY